MILLHEALPDSVVELDLSEDLQEINDHWDSPNQYVDDYWQGATGSIIQNATFYGRVFTKLALGASDIATPLRYGKIEALLNASCEAGLSRNELGSRLEDLVGALVELSSGALEVLEKRVKHSDEELDLVLRNGLNDPFWQAQGSPLILVECKNWSTQVGVDELRIFETKIRDRGQSAKLVFLWH